ncbi:MAG: hypothetical protein ACLFT4_05230, partial [Bacteroidales bacterium]
QQYVFSTCQNYDWNYIVTLEGGNLKTLLQTIHLLNKDSKENKFNERAREYIRHFQSLNELEFNGFFYKINRLLTYQQRTDIKGNSLMLPTFLLPRETSN